MMDDLLGIWKEVILAQNILSGISMERTKKPHLVQPVRWPRFEASSYGICQAVLDIRPCSIVKVKYQLCRS
jgi:hypothetical protein